VQTLLHHLTPSSHNATTNLRIVRSFGQYIPFLSMAAGAKWYRSVLQTVPTVKSAKDQARKPAKEKGEASTGTLDELIAAL
jgi:hypothetical protein